MKVEIVKGSSKNSGKEYIRLDIHLTDDYTKVVFLDSAETALIKATHNDIIERS